MVSIESQRIMKYGLVLLTLLPVFSYMSTDPERASLAQAAEPRSKVPSDAMPAPPADALGFPSRAPNLDALPGFQNPPPGYGEVPFWWWTGDPLDKDRLLWQIQQLHEKGIVGMQVNYAHEDSPGWPTYAAQPEIFSDASYRVLVLPTMRAVRWPTLLKLQQFHRSGGIVIAGGALPETSDRAGREDPELDAIVKELFGATAADAQAGARPEPQTNGRGGIGMMLHASEEAPPRRYDGGFAGRWVWSKEPTQRVYFKGVWQADDMSNLQSVCPDGSNEHHLRPTGLRPHFQSAPAPSSAPGGPVGSQTDRAGSRRQPDSGIRRGAAADARGISDDPSPPGHVCAAAKHRGCAG